MFSNGSEYEWFLDRYCFNCTRFRNWHCRILRKIEMARWIGEKSFPFDDLLDYEVYAGKVCKSFTDVPTPRKKRQIKPLKDQIEMAEGRD